MSNKLCLNSLKLNNFKAIRKFQKTIKFTPLTVFIGNNGSGKSSVIEALEMIYFMAQIGIDEAMNCWHGFDSIWNQAVSHEYKNNKYTNPMAFKFNGNHSNNKYKIEFDISPDQNKDYISLRKAAISYGSAKKDHVGWLLNKLKSITNEWQFLKLVPQEMTEPTHKKHTFGDIKLKENGENIAEYLNFIHEIDANVVNDIIATMKYILPYVEDIRTEITFDYDKKVFLNLIEKGVKKALPGWLFSTGTLRALAIISVLKSPKSPKLLIIEEIENGLDPRTINLLISEIKNYINYKNGQVIITSHSPYFLDLLSLSQIILVERDKNNSPLFIRPSEIKELEKWTKDFSCGQLYTMGNFSRYN